MAEREELAQLTPGEHRELFQLTVLYSRAGVRERDPHMVARTVADRHVSAGTAAYEAAHKAAPERHW